jgi:hypothetical protein
MIRILNNPTMPGIRCRAWLVLAAAGLYLSMPPISGAQGGSAGTSGKLEPRFIVDMPTAGMLPKGTIAVDGWFYENGGLLTGISVGVFDRFSVGISYGGTGIVGSGTPVMNSTPGVALRVRLFDESMILPALAIGFDTQGHDAYLKGLERYRFKSPGLFLVGSKNYALLGFFSLHGGINYSLENADGDRDINAYVGAEKTLGPWLSVLGEYNLGINDSNHDALGKGRGYLNIAVSVALGGGFTIGFQAKDLLQNQYGDQTITRAVRFEFVNKM